MLNENGRTLKHLRVGQLTGGGEWRSRKPFGKDRDQGNPFDTNREKGVERVQPTCSDICRGWHKSEY